MSDQELKRKLSWLQATVIALAGSLVLLVGAVLLLLLDVVIATGAAVHNPDVVYTLAVFGAIMFMLGCLFPTLAWLWDCWRDRRTAEGGAA